MYITTINEQWRDNPSELLSTTKNRGGDMVSPNKAISRIRVRKLFGTYDYSLSASKHASNPDRLMILYGDNGSGKTTILRTLFHLLAPERSEGHKSAVSKVPFMRFDVNFSSGDHVWAQRPENKIIGSFTMGVRLARKKEMAIEFIADDQGSVKAPPKTNAFLSRLKQLDISLYFLSDDRTVQLAGQAPREDLFIRRESSEERGVTYVDTQVELFQRRRLENLEIQSQQILLESIKRAEMWIQSQAVRGAAEGESNVNTLYSEILTRISAFPLETTPVPPDTVQKLEGRVGQLEARSKQFAQYGLLPEFNGRDILNIIKSAPPSHLRIITNVVTPYIESVEKKLDAMEHLQRQIDALVNILNSFFTRKKVNFEIHQGFTITTEGGKQLMPQMLSSGERHLLLLFFNTLITLDRPSIFIIDEPEISLNIKWQRRLLSSLLECAGKNPVQYLFATHSFELLAQYRNNVAKLSEMSEGSNGREANSQ